MDRPLNEIRELLKYSISSGVERSILALIPVKVATPRKKRWDGAYAAVDFPHQWRQKSGGQGAVPGLVSNWPAKPFVLKKQTARYSSHSVRLLKTLDTQRTQSSNALSCKITPRRNIQKRARIPLLLQCHAFQIDK